MESSFYALFRFNNNQQALYTLMLETPLIEPFLAINSLKLRLRDDRIGLKKDLKK